MATPIPTPGSSVYPTPPESVNEPTAATQVQPTIIRIKRKRTDEPLDALGTYAVQYHHKDLTSYFPNCLVVESRSRRKKSRGISSFFQFAETVEEDGFWEDPNSARDLKVCHMVDS